MNIPIRGLWCVALDLSWAIQAGCNDKPLQGGTYIQVPGNNQVEALENARNRIAIMQENRKYFHD